jgi:hypothetical protein
MEWKRLKNKFELVSDPSLVKTEKQFRQCALKKNQDPEIWIQHQGQSINDSNSQKYDIRLQSSIVLDSFNKSFKHDGRPY